MSCPERAAVETPRGNIRSGRVVECRTEPIGLQPVTFVTVEIDGHRLTVPEHEATTP